MMLINTTTTITITNNNNNNNHNNHNYHNNNLNGFNHLVLDVLDAHMKACVCVCLATLVALISGNTIFVMFQTFYRLTSGPQGNIKISLYYS